MTTINSTDPTVGQLLGWLAVAFLFAGPIGGALVAGVIARRRDRRRCAAADIMAMVAATDGASCPCTFWDGDADRADWRPCDEHRDAYERYMAELAAADERLRRDVHA